MRVARLLLVLAIAVGPLNAAEGLKTQQSKIKGLLIVSLPNDEFAGTASQMNCTATEASSAGNGVKVRMNQKVGDSMGKALNEVQKFLKLRHKDWPSGYEIEIAFGDKYSPKDGPSAAVASALLIDSLITGSEIRPTFAVTGDMNADGSVLPIGGVSAKIRGAVRKKCDVVAVPRDNVDNISDMVIMDGRKGLYKTQIFAIDTFDEAWAVSRAAPGEKVAEAIKEFDLIAKVLSAKGERYLGNGHVQKKLARVVEMAPNHLSAQMLLAISKGRGPKRLSLEGSIMGIRSKTGAIMAVVDKGRVKTLSDSLGGDALSTSIRDARGLQKIVDKRTDPYLKAVLVLGEELREYQQNPPRSTNIHNRKVDEINTALDRLNYEYETLITNKSIMEELMIE